MCTCVHVCVHCAVFAIGRHKNPVVRKATVQQMVPLCEKLGPGRLLSGVKDLTDKLLPALASLCADSSPETRYAALPAFRLFSTPCLLPVYSLSTLYLRQSQVDSLIILFSKFL